MIRIKPNWVDSINVAVICPYCGKEHIHGSCNGKSWTGPRAPHCMNGDPDYYIEGLHDDMFVVLRDSIKKFSELNDDDVIYYADINLRKAKQMLRIIEKNEYFPTIQRE